MANVTGSEATYNFYSLLIKGFSFNLTVANASTFVPSSYMTFVDNVVIYNGPTNPSLSYLSTYSNNYTAVH